MAQLGEIVLEMGIVLIICVAISEPRISQRYAGQKILLFLQELCYVPDLIDVEDVKERIIKEVGKEVGIVVLNETVICNSNLVILSILRNELEDKRTIAIIGSVEPQLCDFVSELADLNRKLFVAWNCPQVIENDAKMKLSYTLRTLPAIRDVVEAVFSLFKHFRWKRSTILTIENGAWWTRTASKFEYVLNSDNDVETVSNNTFIVLPSSSSELFIKRQIYQTMMSFESTKANHDVKAILVFIPEHSLIFWRLLRVLVDIGIRSPIVLIRSSSTFYFYRYFASTRFTNGNITNGNCDGNYYKTIGTMLQSSSSSSSTVNSDTPLENFVRFWPNCSNVNFSTSNSNEANLENKNNNKLLNEERDEYDELVAVAANKSNTLSLAMQADRKVSKMGAGTNVVEFASAYDVLKQQLLVLSPFFDETEELITSLIKISTVAIRSQRIYENSIDRFTKNILADGSFLVIDFLNTSSRSILRLRKRGNCTTNGLILDAFDVISLISNSQNWTQLWTNKDNTSSSCFDCDNQWYLDFINEISFDLILLIGVVMIIILVFASCSVMVVKRQYITRKRVKDPCKILLTSEDIVFPQISEPNRIEDGVETMLCCFLQQFQEFGGPEIDKPDLIKGPDDSIKSFPLRHVNSVNSLAKPINSADIKVATGEIKVASTENKARYNGDLVQLKDIPVHGGNFELRSKSLNVLVMIHGLRHENLNPLIGLMVDPIRPALVWEYCSRGSLEDVLIEDEIKLDWSFRLSLLTDLVRGMKYLHSCPNRVHGSLSSRNCVIDARWVLKITDYCLTEFNEAQNITIMNKCARDMLWSAPELLRDVAQMRRGTQAGDVYSFAIIMQEVVLRGEPFCMLSLSPEEIIEKLKTPPPLIRPSVSKGAAPPEAINIMRQCWAEQAEMRPDFNAIHDLFKTLNNGRKINFVDTMFQMLEKYSNNLEALVRQRTEQLDMEKKKTEQLLNRMLPISVAEKLKLGMPVDPEEFSEVTIYFSDIVGFTTISAYSTPFEVVDLLNDLYTCFDATINAYNVYKVETIGDAYMVVGGLPDRVLDHADQVATMALDLLHQSGQFKIRHLPMTPLRLRIGLHTGPCCAGVVGLTMPRYCLFGDTVNTASRLESTGSPGRIHISEATKQKLDMVGQYKLEYRGETELKGKGKMPTYWLLAKEGFTKEIPVPPPITLDEDLIREARNRRPRSSTIVNTPTEYGVTVEHEPLMANQCKPLLMQKSLDSGLFATATCSEHAPRNQKGWTTRRQMTFDLSDHQRNEYYKHSISGGGSAASMDRKMRYIPEGTNLKANESGRSTPFSSSDKNIDLVGVPFVSSGLKAGNTILNAAATSAMTTTTAITSSSAHSKTRKYPAASGVGNPSAAENDLSTPYNYYRCLPPTANESVPGTSSNAGKYVSKFLKRQFSVDKCDDSTTTTSIVLQEMPLSKTSRIFKQNSAGTNHTNTGDKTEKSQQVYKFNNNILPTMSTSAESLT